MKQDLESIHHELVGKHTRKAIDDWMAAKDGRKSRYSELFGTPERAARTHLDYLLNGCDGSTCGDGCPFFDTSVYMNCAAGIDDYDALLEWLRGDAE